MARTTRRYDIDYKIQSVKLAEEIGLNKAAKEIGIPVNTLNGWIKVAREDRLNLGLGFQTPSSAMSLTEELNMLRKQVKEQSSIHNIRLTLEVEV